MSVELFEGSYVAIVTPFYRSNNIDYATLAKLIELHANSKTTGIVVGGCTGESFTLSLAEQKRLISIAVSKAKGTGLKVIAGTGSNNTAEAIELTQHAVVNVGADAVMVITPYANKPPQRGLIEHYKLIAEEAGDLPVMLYNVPGRTCCNLEPETVAELFKIKNIVAIKEASGNIDQVVRISELCDITIMSGDDALTLDMMSRAGARGVISVSANVAPDSVADVVHAFLGGDTKKAAKLNAALLPLHAAMFFDTNPIPVKKCLELLGITPEPIYRLPLVPIGEGHIVQLREVLEAQGLLEPIHS